MNFQYQLEHGIYHLILSLEFPDGQYSVSDIQDYFEYIIKNLAEYNDNTPIRIHANAIENRITLRTKTVYDNEITWKH